MDGQGTGSACGLLQGVVAYPAATIDVGPRSGLDRHDPGAPCYITGAVGAEFCRSPVEVNRILTFVCYLSREVEVFR